MSHVSSTDERFLGMLESWLQTQREILLLIRYSHAGGAKDFEFFSSVDTVRKKVRSLQPCTCVIAFKQSQLPIRGFVDDRLIDACLSSIPDGAEYLVMHRMPRTCGRYSWFHYGDGESHAELREELEGLRGEPVFAGLYPIWWQDDDNVISAIVPDEHGVVTIGVF